MAELTGRQTVFTYSFLFKSSRSALDSARQIEEGSFYQLLNCLVMAAFTVEAYLNHLILTQFEREFREDGRINIWAKYRRIRVLSGLSGVGVPEAYPLVAGLIEFRNAIAHGRTEVNYVSRETEETSMSIAVSQIRTGWRESVNLQYATDALCEVEALVHELHNATGLGDNPFGMIVSGLYSLSLPSSDESPVY